VGTAVYVLGGRTAFEADETLSDLWRFDVPAASWSLVHVSGAVPPPLSYHAMASDGPWIYLFGGCTNDHGRSNALYRLDTRSHEWSCVHPHVPADAPNAASTAPCPRGGPGLAGVDGTVFVGFGYNGHEEQSDLWRLDASRVGQQPGPRWQRVELAQDSVKPAARSVTDLVALPNFCQTQYARLCALVCVLTHRAYSSTQLFPLCVLCVGSVCTCWLPDAVGAGRHALYVFGGEFTPSVQGHEGAGEYHRDAFVFNVHTHRWHAIEVGAALLSCSPLLAVHHACQPAHAICVSHVFVLHADRLLALRVGPVRAVGSPPRGTRHPRRRRRSHRAVHTSSCVAGLTASIDSTTCIRATCRRHRVRDIEIIVHPLSLICSQAFDILLRFAHREDNVQSICILQCTSIEAHAFHAWIK
jgi:hypothetical protein